MATPEKREEPMNRLLHEGHVPEFNRRRQAGESCSLSGEDLRGVDLRQLDAADLDMSHCYLRQADLRGVDFSRTNLEGASIYCAKISGAWFPPALSAEEINLSLVHGTRMRYNR